MNEMVEFLIDEFIKDLEDSELYDKIEDEDFQKDKKELIDVLEAYKDSRR